MEGKIVYSPENTAPENKQLNMMAIINNLAKKNPIMNFYSLYLIPYVVKEIFNNFKD